MVTSDLERLRRWEEAGGTWQLAGTGSDGRTTVALCRCDGGEVVDRLVSADPELIAYVRLGSGA